MKYYTDQNVNITKRIEEGKTLFFNGIDKQTKGTAKAEARRIKSYVYEVFVDNRNKRVQVGYAVPK